MNRNRVARGILSLFLVAGAAAKTATAQVATNGITRDLVSANNDIERYLRVLQDVGLTPPVPWGIRPFGPRLLNLVVPRDSAHPWGRYLKHPGPSLADLYVLAPEVGAIYNSGFAYGYNDGPIWAGRGPTFAAQAGLGGHVGPLSFVIAPMWFRAQNASFPIVSGPSATGRLIYADPVSPFTIDQPQRMGDTPYGYVDPGQSQIRVDLPILAFGISTANQSWGPGIDNPIILGNNAAGFPHAFVGTSEPADLWLFKFNMRVEWGRLDQSRFAVLEGTQSRRFMSGIIASIQPRGLDGLEIGGTRFFHSLWPDSGLTRHDFTRPFEGLLLSSLGHIGGGTGQEPDNQLSSIYARWVAPSSGVEVYAEFGREDHSLNLRDAVLEPDHNAAYMLGFQKAYKRAGNNIVFFRAEWLNSRFTSLDLIRPQQPFYVHDPVVQGHTERGQVLGAPAGYGGAGSVVEIGQYRPDGGWSASWNRLNREPSFVNEERADVLHTLALSRQWLLSHIDIKATLGFTRELNRNFLSDASNVNVGLALRPRF